MPHHVEPSIELRSFTCPHCSTLSRVSRWGLLAQRGPLGPWKLDGYGSLQHAKQAIGADVNLVVSCCDHCGGLCLFLRDRLVEPEATVGPPPAEDMPEDVRADYMEAAAIARRSPRAAAALLRLAMEKLMRHLGLNGPRLDDDIKALVRAGLDPTIAQALDVIRVTGNNAVHPGTLAVDDTDTAAALFPLLNLIVQARITIPKQVRAQFDALPPGAKAAIAKRDGAAGGPSQHA